MSPRLAVHVVKALWFQVENLEMNENKQTNVHLASSIKSGKRIGCGKPLDLDDQVIEEVEEAKDWNNGRKGKCGPQCCMSNGRFRLPSDSKKRIHHDTTHLNAWIRDWHTPSHSRSSQQCRCHLFPCDNHTGRLVQHQSFGWTMVFA